MSRKNYTFLFCDWEKTNLDASSCGTRTSGKAKSTKNLKPAGCTDVKTDYNVCTTNVWRNSAGTAGGVPLFVATDCTTGKPLPFCKQDPIYLKQRVARESDVHRDWREDHVDYDLEKPLKAGVEPRCKASMGMA